MNATLGILLTEVGYYLSIIMSINIGRSLFEKLHAKVPKIN